MLRILMLVTLLGSMLAAMSSMVHAKDVSAQQAGSEYAREAMLKAEVEHLDNLKKVAASEKDLVDVQKRLAEDRKKADASKIKLDQSKAKYEKAQELLSQAWKQP